MRSRRHIARHIRRNLPINRWQHVPDPRGRQGRRYTLPPLLQLLVVGLCVAAPTTRDVENLTQDLRVKKALGLVGNPSDTTLERLIAQLPIGPLRQVLREMNHDAWRAKRYAAVPLLDMHLVAVDGKTIGCDPEHYHPEAQPQGPGGKSGPYILRVLRACLVSATAQPVLDQMVLPADGGEPDNFLEFFEALRESYGRLGMLECVSVDAGFTSRENLHAVDAAGVGFIAGLKGNQPTLYEEALRLVGAEEELPPWTWEDTYTEARGRRVVTRWLTRQVFPAGFHGWTAPTQIWRIRQRVETPAGGVTWEDRFFLTNLAWDRLSARACMWAIRLHWGIENGPNWTLDMQWKEDQRAWVRQGRGLEVLGLLRSLAYNIVRLLRERALRSAANRGMAWRRLFEIIRMALTTPGILAEPATGFG